MTRAVSIVIPTWNGLDLLKRFLPTVTAAAENYAASIDSAIEVVVVDDGSVDDSVAWLHSRGFELSRTEPGHEDFPRGIRLTLVRNETNQGFGETCNRGFEAARYPLVFLLNNDVEVDSSSIAPLVEHFDDDSVFAVHCRVFELGSDRECGAGKLGGFKRGFIRVHKSYVPRSTPAKDPRIGPVHEVLPLYSMFAGGGSAMFDREKFIRMGGFSPLLSPFYWEDVEISYRAWKRGFTVLYEPRSVTRHRISSTITRLNRHKVRRIEQRNRLIYHWIHLHDRLLLASHICWVLTLALTAPLRLKPSFLLSCIAALKRIPEIRKCRLEERNAARRSDQDVFDIFAHLQKRPDVFAYDDHSELAKMESETTTRSG